MKTTLGRLAQMTDAVKFETSQAKLVREWDLGFQENNLGLIAKPLHEDFSYATPDLWACRSETKSNSFEI